jgi:anti-sigma regulatory factor (Ser/Thr protein kinase)
VEQLLPSASREQLSQLRRLTLALGDALTVDDAVRAALTTAGGLPGFVRAAIALTEGGGRQLRFVSTDPEGLTETGPRWCSIDAYSDLPIVHAVRDRRDIFLGSPADIAPTYPEIAEHQASLGVRSLVTVPLMEDDEAIGALMFGYDAERSFSHDDRWFFGSFAAQTTQAIRRGIAYQIQHATSEQLQRSLMPHSLPDVDRLTLGAHYSPGGRNVDVGGDWYDVLALPDGSVALALGDVMGKGVPAAIVMGEVRAAVRAYAVLDAAPSVVLRRLDSLLSSIVVPEQIVTLVYGVLSPDRRTFTYSVAGHPPPVVVPRNGSPTVLDDLPGPALMGIGRATWPEYRLGLDQGATLLLYSDGLVEARDLDLLDGVKQLCAHIESLPPRRRNPRDLCARLADLMWREDIDDDVTVLAAAVTAPGHARTAGVELPVDLTAPNRARRFVGEKLVEWGVPEEVTDTAQLCVSELVTNAIIHSGTGTEVTVRLDEEFVTVLVQDRGGHGTVQRAEHYDPMSVSGRGLTLVEALCTSWSAEHSADGTTVWFELELPG